MKKALILLGSAAVLTFTACKKGETAPSAEVENTSPVVQTLTGENGEKISVEYFDDNSVVSVKIKKGAEEHILKGKSTSDSGNPLFSDGVYVWEMQADAQSGKLTDKSGKSVLYK